MTLASALRRDVSDLVLFDDHDPLGLAFYIQGIVQSGYVSPETNELALAGQLWANEKLDNPELLSAYKDRDINAVALMLYSLKDAGSNETDGRFERLVTPFIDQRGAVCDSFFCSSLVCLALRSTNASGGTLELVSHFVNNQLDQNYSLVLNDPKNLVVAYWWAQESSHPPLKAKLVHTARTLVQRVQPTLDELVYGSFILLNEAANMARHERRLVKTAVERSLLSIEEYTNESLSPLGVFHYGRDAARFVEEMEGYDAASKPRLSRILISVGLILQAAYRQKLPALLSRRARVLQVVRAAQALLIIMIFASLSSQAAVSLGFPGNAKTPLQSPDPWQVLRGIEVLLGDCFFAVILFSALFWSYRFVVDLGIRGCCQDELDVFRRGWHSFESNIWPLIALPIITGVLVALIT